MDWLHHPRFARQRAEAIRRLKHDEYDFLRTKKVVFLCGGFESRRRDALSKYLARFADDTLVFYAEAVWAVIAEALPNANALAIEEQLAALADIVVVVVESVGTFAEIGAFALSAPLRSKLLPILDGAYKNTDSFLTTGPIRWVDNDSLFGPSIWTDFGQILVAASEVQDRLSRIARSRPARISSAALLNSPKHLLFFVCDIIAVFGPCPMTHISDTVHRILETHIDINLYVALGKALRLLGSFPVAGMEHYYRRLEDGRLLAFQRKRRIDLATLRSQVLSAMQKCEPCIPVLTELKQHL